MQTELESLRNLKAHVEAALDRSLGNSWGEKVARFADRWWVVFVILWGAAFVFGVPFQRHVW